MLDSRPSLSCISPAGVEIGVIESPPGVLELGHLEVGDGDVFKEGVIGTTNGDAVWRILQTGSFLERKNG